MTEFKELVENLDLSDLHALSTDEKTELFQLLNSICRSPIIDQKTFEENIGHTNNIVQQVEEVKEKVCKVQTSLLKASGNVCKDPGAYLKLTTSTCPTQDANNILLTNISVVGLEYSTPTPGNGDCFFEAISDQLKRLGRPEQNAGTLRQNVVEFCRVNPTLQRDDGIIELKDYVVEDGTFGAYLNKMSQQGEWADHVIVIAMAAYLNTEILVVTSVPNASIDENMIWIHSGNSANHDVLLLGHIFENHYQSLRPYLVPTQIGNDNHELDSSDEDVADYMTHYIKDEPFLQFVQSTICKRNSQDMECILQRISIEEDEDDIMTSHLIDIDRKSQGIFSHRNQNKTTIQYKCERSARPRGKKRGPHETVANGCSAYISFQFFTHMGKKAVIIRQKLCHTGHNLDDVREKHCSKPDTSLIEYVHSLLNQNKKPMEIVCKAWQWARERGKYDVHDRRYFLTPMDIKNIAQKHRQKQRNTPLIIIYQNKTQRDRMKMLAKNVVFLDATYKGITAYGYVFYTLVARNDHGKGTPLSYCISSDDTSYIVRVFLENLQISAKQHGFLFYPRSFMVDRDTKEIGAIATVFPNTCILLCWFHVLQAIYRFLNKRDSGISGQQNAYTRKEVIQYIRSMKMCTKKDDFMEKVQHLHQTMPNPAVTRYLVDNWCNEVWGARWSNFGRHFYHEDHDTNNLVERFFLSIKYHFLGGYSNHRIDELLMLIDGNITDFYDYMDELGRHGRLKNMRTIKEKRGRNIAEDMLKAGLDKDIKWLTTTECVVPSQTSMETTYTVDILNCSCTCPASTQTGLCKHVHLALMVAASKNIDVVFERRQQAQSILDSGNYYYDIEINQVEIISNKGDVSVVNLAFESPSCSCFANSHGIKCVCLLVVEKVVSTIMPDSNSCNELETSVDDQTESIEQTILRKVNEISVFVKGDLFENLPKQKKEKMLQSLNAAHNICHFSEFRKISRKRKQQPLNENRKTRQKCNEHDYSLNNLKDSKKDGSKLHEDGNVKKFNRNSGAIRKTFT